MDYTHTVYYVDEFGDEFRLGDETSLEEAKRTVKDWCDECEDKHAKNSKNYKIREYTGD